MVYKDVKYTDYNGNQVTDRLHFNLNQYEILKMDSKYPEGLEEHILSVVRSGDKKKIMDWFEEFVCASYGIKSEDGKRFIKSKDIAEAFIQSEAFNSLFFEFLSDQKAMSDFFNAIIQQSDIDRAKLLQNMQNKADAPMVTPM